MVSPPSLFVASALVAVGGAAGSVLRFQAGRWVSHLIGPQAASAFPWATLGVNVAGSFAMGLITAWLARYSGAATGGNSMAAEPIRLLIAVGLLGGFTTFSAFSLDLVVLMERGQPFQAMAYGAVSVLAGLCALYIGLFMMRIAG